MGWWWRLLVLVNCLALSLFGLLAAGEAADRASKRTGGTPTISSTASFTAPTRADAPQGPELRRGGYEDLISLMSAEEGVDANLVRAIITVESRFDPNAVSRKGAKGLMQLMPETAARYAVRDPFDPEANIRGGVRYLRFLQELFPGRLPWALAAYNAGENAVLRHNGVPPFRETREYVDRVLAHYGRRDQGANSLAIQRRHPTTAAAEGQGSPSAPMIFRVESDEVVLYTNVSAARRRAPRSVQ